MMTGVGSRTVTVRLIEALRFRLSVTVEVTESVPAAELPIGRPVVAMLDKMSLPKLSKAFAPLSSALRYVSPMLIETIDAPNKWTTRQLLSRATMVSRAEDRSPAEV